MIISGINSGNAGSPAANFSPAGNNNAVCADNTLTGANTDGTVISDSSVVNKTASSNKDEAAKSGAKKADAAVKGKRKDNNDDGKDLRFKIHKGTGQTMIQVVDDVTGKVIREIPPERILDSIAEIWKSAGINVDRKI